MSIKDNLRNFYNAQAENFSQTRIKKWPEFDIILGYINDYINKSKKSKISILELGCGDGRFYRFLKDNLKKVEIDYIGIDLSEKLINLAKQKSIGGKFEVSDMSKYLENLDQQNMDIVVSIASFQHIPSYKERIIILKNIYRVLEYGGVNIMINWSFSKWFLSRFKKEIVFAILKWILSLGYLKRNDLCIPWKSKEGKIYKRYYHIFLLKELVNLYKLAGFVIKLAGYVDRDGKITNNWKNSRNTIIIGEKEVVKFSL